MELPFLTISHTGLQEHRSVALGTPASTSAQGCAVRDAGVPNTSPAFCLQTAHNSKAQGHIRNKDLSYQVPQAVPP